MILVIGMNGNNGLLLQLNLYLFDFGSSDFLVISSIVLAPLSVLFAHVPLFLFGTRAPNTTVPAGG